MVSATSLHCRITPTHKLAVSNHFLSQCVLQEPGVQYEYEVRGSGDTFSFEAVPESGPGARFSFVVYADMGESDHARAKAPGSVTASPSVLPSRSLIASSCQHTAGFQQQHHVIVGA